MNVSPEVRKLLPRSYRERNKVEWIVTYDGAAIGHIEQWSTRNSSTTFFRATSIDPKTTRIMPLESSPDFEERVARVVDAHLNPAEYAWRHSWIPEASTGPRLW